MALNPDYELRLRLAMMGVSTSVGRFESAAILRDDAFGGSSEFVNLFDFPRFRVS
jgi:hypothetical protein